LKQVALLLSKWNQFSYAVLPVASAPHVARRRLLRQRRAFECLGTSCGSSRSSSRCSSSTTPPRAGLSSTTSPTPRVRVPQHVARLVVDYLAASSTTWLRRAARCTARLATRHRLLHLLKAHRRLLHLCRASGCLGTSRGSLSTTLTTPRVRLLRHVARLVARLIVDYFTSHRLVVHYFVYAARPGASARRAAHQAARRRLLRLEKAHHRLLRLHRASGCLGTLHGSSCSSSSTTSI
jgi:hypothetical protein